MRGARSPVARLGSVGPWSMGHASSSPATYDSLAGVYRDPDAASGSPRVAGLGWLPVDDGTRVTQTIDAEPGGFLKLAGPLLASAVKRQFGGYLDDFRDLMESDAL